MNVNKQTREYIALGVLLTVLAIAIVFFLQSSKPKPVVQKPPDTKTEQRKAKAVSSKAAINSKNWVAEQEDRIPSLIAEVKGGRNPFKDLQMPAVVEEPTAPPPVTRQQSDPIPPSGQLYGRSSTGPDGPLPIDVEKIITLRWINWRDAAAALKKEGITDVTVSAGRKAGTARFSGPEVSVRDALDNIIARLDVEPPAPDFQLRGVITTASANMAVLSVNGKTYSLYQGDIIPGLGWTLQKVTPSSVTLKKKGYTSVTRRLAGGKA